MGSSGLIALEGKQQVARRTWMNVFVDQAIVSGTNFVTLVFVGRTLGKKELGLYVLLYGLVIVILEVQNSFIASPYILDIPRLDPVSRARYTGDALLLSLGLGVIGAVSLLIASCFLPKSGNNVELRSLAVVLSLVIVPILAKEQARRTCLANSSPGPLLAIDIVASIVQLGGLLSMKLLFVHSLQTVFWIIGVASGLAVTMWIALWRQRIILTLSSAVCTLRRTCSFGIYVLTGNLAFVLSQQLYPWLLAWLCGPETTGTFAAYVGVLSLINPAITAVGNQLGPVTAHAAARSLTEMSAVVNRASLLLFGGLVLFCSGILFMGTPIMRLLYGSTYAVSFAIVAVLAASVLAYNFSLPQGFGFWALGRPDMNLKINSLAILCAVCFGPWLVKSFGLLGASCGLLVGNMTVSMFRVVLLKTFIRLRISAAEEPECERCQSA